MRQAIQAVGSTTTGPANTSKDSPLTWLKRDTSSTTTRLTSPPSRIGSSQKGNPILRQSILSLCAQKTCTEFHYSVAKAK